VNFLLADSEARFRRLPAAPHPCSSLSFPSKLRELFGVGQVDAVDPALGSIVSSHTSRTSHTSGCLGGTPIARVFSRGTVSAAAAAGGGTVLCATAATTVVVIAAPGARQRHAIVIQSSQKWAGLVTEEQKQVTAEGDRLDPGRDERMKLGRKRFLHVGLRGVKELWGRAGGMQQWDTVTHR
jgi:hypothetical protein